MVGRKRYLQCLGRWKRYIELREERGHDFTIACNVGIKIDNAKTIIEKEADELIVGTGIFESPRFSEIVKEFLELLKS